MTDISRDAVEALAYLHLCEGNEYTDKMITALLAAKEQADADRDENWQKYFDANESRIDAEAERDALMEKLDVIARGDIPDIKRFMQWHDKYQACRAFAIKALKQPKEGDSNEPEN